MLRRWVREAGELSGAHKDTAASAPQSISVEIRCGNIAVQAELPLDSCSAAWLRAGLG